MRVLVRAWLLALFRGFFRAGAPAAGLVAVGVAAPTAAQLYSDQEGDRIAAVQRELRLSDLASTAKFAYETGDWAAALKNARETCDGNQPLGCQILGLVLAEGRAGTPDPRGGEAAHRKAAALHAQWCTNSSTSGDACIDAGDFLRVDAVAAVKNPALARTYYARALAIHGASCDRGAYECYMAGYLAYTDLNGRSDPAAAIRYWRRGCDYRDGLGEGQSDAVSSCNRLVGQLAEGPEAVRDYTEARRRLLADQCAIADPARRASRGADRVYCAVLGELLLNGQGGPADPALGEKLLRFSCGREQQSACTSLTNRGLGVDDYKAALALKDFGATSAATQLFKTRCAANVAAACNEAGALINRGATTRMAAGNTDEARQLFARACVLGNMDGCYNSGVNLRRLGGGGNFIAARAAFAKGCAANHAAACRFSGVMLATGQGGAVDRAAANAAYRAGCDGRDAVACLNLGVAARDGLGVAADPVAARGFLEKSCDLGNAAGCNNFGFLVSTGRGGEADPARARTLYRKGCDGNDGQGCNNIAFLLREGRGGPADPVEARKLFEKGCNLNNADACVGYSDSLLTSAGGPTDLKKAINMRQYACLALNRQAACQWLADGGHRDDLAEATILANSGKSERAAPIFVRLCEANNAKACLGAAAYSTGGNRDQMRALMQKACRLGEKSACATAEELGS